ncbi:MAG TPA: hypothetical protein VFE65_36820 [Pseudonocardia sp.]|jgi:hypothetical protein|nr:hypothetical protein [Pseudonocardia sp.]
MTTVENQTMSVGVRSGPTSAGSTADWELAFARRALATLKTRLGRQGLLDLLRPDIEASTEQMSTYLADSGGQWQLASTELQVSGLTSDEFLTHFESIREDEPKMVAVHPEHFVMAAIDGGVKVVENLGPFITEIDVVFAVGDDTEQAVGDVNPDYPIRMLGRAVLSNGETAAHLLHQFRDTSVGFDALLGIYFPQAAPGTVVETHRQHLAVEFTNWIIGAGQALGRSTA